MKPEDIKLMVRDKYAAIAQDGQTGGGCCGQTGSDCATVYNVMGDDYNAVQGYVPEADLGLGCGLPTEHAGIREGMTVLDLGSGAGNDAFIAARIVGEQGRVVGVDMTDEMIQRARKNQQMLGMKNVEFKLGEIERLPVDDASVDVIISNCVLNLVPDKKAAFTEMYRVLRPGGHFCVSDIVLEGQLPEAMREVATLYAGCISGAEQKSDYMEHMAMAGFQDLVVRKEKDIVIPEGTLQLLAAELEPEQRTLAGSRILSVTVTGIK